MLYEKYKEIHFKDYLYYQLIYYVLRSFELLYQVRLVYLSICNATEKLNAIEFASPHSQRDVVDRFDISLGTVNNILKKKQEIQMVCEENCNPQMKRFRFSSHCEVNYLIWQLFLTARSNNILITGPIL